MIAATDLCLPRTSSISYGQPISMDELADAINGRSFRWLRRVDRVAHRVRGDSGHLRDGCRRRLAWFLGDRDLKEKGPLTDAAFETQKAKLLV